ncbi:hypothetical protein BD410DRAFT_881085 [Rickenella mellea]|uniref:Uncharacterized protein n=1 Tax=Rickenella mellea TaxID=50990 RepID=A0A4Y7PSR0_9AGAM|nr:hypothetical protein BD410DRAFT_881085 [Rickenella mellea]
MPLSTISFLLPSSTRTKAFHKPPPPPPSAPRRFIEISSLTSQPAHPHRRAYIMTVSRSRSPSRSPRRRPSAVASSSRGSLMRVFSQFSKKALRGGAARSGSLTLALTIESAEFPATLATEREEAEGDDDEVSNNDPNDTLDDSDVHADATDESPHRKNAIEDPTEYDTPETRNETADDSAATVKDALPTSPIVMGSADASSHTHDAPFELTLPWFTARPVGGSTTCTEESVIRSNVSDNQNIIANEHTDVPASYPVTNGAATLTAEGSSKHTTTAFSESAEQPQSASNKGKKRTASQLAHEGESDDENEALVTKRARMSGEDEAEERGGEEKRERKKRARSDDDDRVSPTLSGEKEATTKDDQHRAKRTKHSLEGSSLSYGSTSPRCPGATVDNDANHALPTPEESQENENEENIPPAIPMAQVIATLTFHGLVTPDASVASDDDDSDSSYSPGSSESSSSDSDDTDTGSGDESDDNTAAPPAPAAAPAPVFVVPPGPPPPLVPHPNQLRRTRAFYGYNMLYHVLHAPYI